VQIKPEDRQKKLNMNYSDGSDNEQDNEDNQETELTPEQQRMQEILNKKGQQIILALMDQLSTRNRGDLEVALNSYTILMEFTEND